jgi:hypothetical protein
METISNEREVIQNKLENDTVGLLGSFLNKSERTPEDTCALSKEFLLPSQRSKLVTNHSYGVGIILIVNRFKFLEKITNFYSANSQQSLHNNKGPILRGMVLPTIDAYDPTLYGRMVKMNTHRGWQIALFFCLVDMFRGFFVFSFFLSPPFTLLKGLGPPLIQLAETA